MPIHVSEPEARGAQPASRTEEAAVPDAHAALALDRARATDAAWRAERSAHFQSHIDDAHALERHGRDWALTPQRGFFEIGIILGFASPFLFTLFAWGFGFNSALPCLAATTLLLVSARVSIGLSLWGLSRLERRYWVQIAQRASIQVADPGDLPSIHIRQLLPPP